MDNIIGNIQYDFLGLLAADWTSPTGVTGFFLTLFVIASLVLHSRASSAEEENKKLKKENTRLKAKSAKKRRSKETQIETLTTKCAKLEQEVITLHQMLVKKDLNMTHIRDELARTKSQNNVAILEANKCVDALKYKANCKLSTLARENLKNKFAHENLKCFIDYFFHWFAAGKKELFQEKLAMQHVISSNLLCIKCNGKEAMRLVAKWDDVISKYKTDLESLGGFKADCESIPVVDLLNID